MHIFRAGDFRRRENIEQARQRDLLLASDVLDSRILSMERTTV